MSLNQLFKDGKVGNANFSRKGEPREISGIGGIAVRCLGCSIVLDV